MKFYFFFFIMSILISFFFISIILINKKNAENDKDNKTEKSNNFVFLNNIVIILLVLFIGICVANKYFQNDTFFTIALGEETLQNGVHNKEVLTYHENFKYYNIRWLFNVVIALLNKQFGFNGIYGFVILITTFISFSLCYCLNKITNNKLLCFFITCFAMYFSNVFFVARAQIVSILIFVIEYYSILMLAKTGRKKYFYTLLILPLIIVNFHASTFPFYLILYLPIIVEHILSKFKFTKKISCISFDTIKHVKYLYLAFIINIFESFISPLGFSPFFVMFNAIGGISKIFILELQPIEYDSIYMLYFVDYSYVFAYSCLLVKEKVKAHTIFLLIGLAIISIISRRNLLLFFIVGAFSIAENLNIFLKENKNINMQFTKNKLFFLRSFILLPIIIIFSTNFIKNISREYIDHTYYPVEATEYIINNIDLSKHTLFNGFNYGSYLEYKGIKTFMDSRSEVYEKNYNNTSILEDFYYLTTIGEKQLDYKIFFDKYDITLALIYKVTNENSLYEQQIKPDIHNCLNCIYEDDYYAIYEVLK